MTELESRTPAQSPENISPAHHKHRAAAIRRRGPLNIAVIAMAAGLIGTVALPAYASTGLRDAKPTSARQSYVNTNAQTLSVAPAVSIAAVQRDSYTTTLPPKPKPVPQPAAARSGAVAGNAGLPPFSLDGIVADGLKYVGVPYVYGGSTPAGFDCSGFVMFLYSHVGIHLAHNARIQGQSGTVISRANARPGDLVVLADGSHDGIYMGNNQIMDAPKPGGFVSVRTLWTTSVIFVRL